MAGTRQRVNTNRRQATEGRNTYVQGSAVRKLDVQRELQNPSKRSISHATRKNRDKAVHMNAVYVLFLSVALLVAGGILISYIRLQFNITASVETISTLEAELMDLRLQNDEEYARINSAVNLEEIKRVAIEELGMQYAREDQVIEVTDEANDYVRQFADIP